MSGKSLKDTDIVNAMEGVPVLVVGDIMLDRFVYGRVERISPESPVPVLSVTRENIMLGGAGNTLSNLINLRCQGKILSIIGDDEDGTKIKDLAQKQGIDVSGLIQSPKRLSIVKTRFLAGHQQLLRTDFERIEDISDKLADQLLEKATALLSDVKVMILSDYGKGILTPKLLKSLIALANDKDVTVLVDPKGTDYSIYAGADIVTPNKKELSESTGGLAVDTDGQVIEAARKLIDTSGIHAVIATRSKDGMSIVAGQGKDITHIRSASDIEVFDVSGAGDTVIATIAAALATGADIVAAASLANVAGSIVVAKVGTAPIRAQELLDVLRHHDPADNARAPRIERTRQAPVLGDHEAREEILRWKARGLKIGFTNGCFDIVHFGHVTYLNDARHKCDRLVVGLNSDSSVRILKGETRPVHDEQSRAAVLAALGSVDMVVLFGAKEQGQDNTACDLLDLLQPDIYFKGGDYTIDQIPEAPTVQKHGGIVDVMPVYEGHSTTKSIQKMQG
ncbi:MAG: D-glycero-beta-D-manno-heptose-7-phosphate kinase [Alphaproteobacteria bacterium]|nr:MAG: D-glycero-beta-D-manno-heptose-7-phosphate kinase [Alphaproteobacteria bacterium]